MADEDKQLIDALDALLADRSSEVHVSRKDLIKRLCAACGEVATLMKHEVPADCFCCPAPATRFLFDEKVIAFVEAAVKEKIDGIRKSLDQPTIGQ